MGESTILADGDELGNHNGSLICAKILAGSLGEVKRVFSIKDFSVIGFYR